MKTPSEVLCKRLNELAAAVAAGPVTVAREFTMRIPAQPDRDADIVLSEAAKRIRELETRVYQLESLLYGPAHPAEEPPQ